MWCMHDRTQVSNEGTAATQGARVTDRLGYVGGPPWAQDDSKISSGPGLGAQ